jgi:hypothetical protein
MNTTRAPTHTLNDHAYLNVKYHITTTHYLPQLEKLQRSK